MELDDVTFRDDEGVVAVCVALRCTLYLRNSFEPARREAIPRVVRAFVLQSRGALRWLLPTRTGAQALTGDEVRRPIEAKLADLQDSDEPWELHLHGGESAEAASDLGLQVLVRRRWEEEPPHNQLSFLSLRFPLLWFADVRPGFPSFVLDCCTALKPTHGYGGIGVVTAADRFLSARFDTVVASLAERFPGLEIDYPAKHLIWVRSGIKGINWLTILGDEWLAPLGGVTALRAALPETVALHPYPGGCLIQAGTFPQVGDRNRRLDLVEYRQVARALRPVSITTHSAVHGADGMDRSRFERWLRRFDE